MRNSKHIWKITVSGVALAGLFYFAATSHRTTQAAARAKPAVVQPVSFVETTPIVPAESSHGGGSLDSTNKTDW